jgi:hypothetical protein
LGKPLIEVLAEAGLLDMTDDFLQDLLSELPCVSLNLIPVFRLKRRARRFATMPANWWCSSSVEEKLNRN